MRVVGDLSVGAEIGRWTVIGVPVMAAKRPGGKQYKCVPCRCECGTVANISCACLVYGRTRGCGCGKWKKGTPPGAELRQGEHYTRLYHVWRAMIKRCSDPRDKQYHRYGGRGIQVCTPWAESFGAFYEWAVGGGYRVGLTIERENNAGNYEPANCTWATYKDQAGNTRRNYHVAAFGETKIMSEWLEDARCTVNRLTLRSRLKTGWSPEDAMTLPPYSIYRKAHSDASS